MVRSLAAAVALAASFGVPSYASTLSGSLGGSFSTPTGSTATTFVYSGEGTDTLRWGAASGASHSVTQGDSASIGVSGGAFSIDTSAPGDVLLGSISWDNQSNWYAGGKWDSTLTLSFQFNTSSGLQTRTVTVDFSVDNIGDTTADTAANEASGLTADIITAFAVNGIGIDQPLLLENDLSLEKIFFRLDDAGTPGTSVSFLQDGKTSGSRYNPLTGQWENREGGVSTIGIYAAIETVPLPAGVWLLLSGLISVFVIRRRKSGAV